MLLSALVLVLGLLPSAFAQFPAECNDYCVPVEDYLGTCVVLPTPAEGLACINAVCTTDAFIACVGCASPATGYPPEQYYDMFSCAVPPVVSSSVEPSPSSTTAEPNPTCGHPGKGKGHDKGRGKGHGKHGDDE